jgi:hypothetical protein
LWYRSRLGREASLADLGSDGGFSRECRGKAKKEVVMRKGFVIMLGLLVVVAVRPCSAQGQAAPVATANPGAVAAANPDVNEVIFYQGSNFKGDSLTLQAPEDVPNLDKTRYGSWSERIKSLKVGADVIVVMYSWSNYSNDCVVFRGTNVGGAAGRYADLTKYGINARARSLRVFLKTYPEKACASSR